MPAHISDSVQDRSAPERVAMLPLLLLVCALVWRSGRDAFSWETGLTASLLLAGSAFFLTYMAVARAFCQAAFFATLLVWSYLRCAQGLRQGSRCCSPGTCVNACRPAICCWSIRRFNAWTRKACTASRGSFP